MAKAKKKLCWPFIHFNKRDFRRAAHTKAAQRNLSQENSVKTMATNKLQRKEPITISSIAIYFHKVHILWIHTVPTPVYVCAHKYFRKNCCYVRSCVRDMNFSSFFLWVFPPIDWSMSVETTFVPQKFIINGLYCGKGTQDSDNRDLCHHANAELCFRNSKIAAHFECWLLLTTIHYFLTIRNIQRQ